MATSLYTLDSRSGWFTDGTTINWNFAFSGGYLDRDHVKAMVVEPDGQSATAITLTPEHFIGPNSIRITPAIVAGKTFVIYRSTPKDLPLVDFQDGARISETSLDIVAKQGVFLAAEAFDSLSVSSETDLALAVGRAEAAAAQAAADAATISLPLVGTNVRVTGPGGYVRTLQALFGDNVSVKDFGAIGDGIADDTAAIVAAIAYCQLNLRNLHFPAGVYKITSTITLDGAPVGLIGEVFGPMQQGSTRPGVTLRWHGGTAPMFSCLSSSWSFVGMALENFTTATDFLEVFGGQHFLFNNLSFSIGSGANRFSRSVIYSAGNNCGYSTFWRIHGFSPAPKFLYIDGLGSSNGVTPIEFGGRCVFESNTAGRMDVVYITDENIDSLHIHDTTCNQQTNELCLVNMETGALDPACTQLTITDCEFDTNASGVSDRYLRLKNVRNAVISRNTVNGGGAVTAIANLTNCVVNFDGNYWERVAGFFFAPDLLSRVYPGLNFPNVANTQGVVSDAATGSGLYSLTYGPTVTILGHLARQGEVFRINITNNTPFTVSFAHPGIGGNGYFYRGQVFGLQFRNISGGAMGAATPVGAYFKLGGSAFPVPLNGFSRTVWLMWDGANLVEVARTTTDIPN